MRTLRVFPLLAALLTALWLAPAALAHAHYVSSNPASGARLSAAPSSVTITYDDDLDPNATVVTVLGPNGQTVSTGKTTITVEATKAATVAINGAGAGTYTVQWHAVADDDKGVTEGTFTFSVGGAPGAAAAQAAMTTTAATTTQAQPALPTSGGGGMAMAAGQVQVSVSLAAALLTALLLTLTVGARGPGGNVARTTDDGGAPPTRGAPPYGRRARRAPSGKEPPR